MTSPIHRPFLLLVLVSASAMAAGLAMPQRQSVIDRTNGDGLVRIVVTTTADSGEGSLRAAIETANAQCGLAGPHCLITFAPLTVARPGEWYTIRPLSPLPAIGSGIALDGETTGDVNPLGPDVELNGALAGDANGLEIRGCATTIANLAINGFARFGISIGGTPDPCVYEYPRILGNYVGTDPTGTLAVPNERGIAILGRGIPPVIVAGNVISGNRRSGIWADGGSWHFVTDNRIGLAARENLPVPNQASGIYVAPGTSLDVWENTIAYNGEWGVSVHPSAFRVSIRRNEIHSNFALGIDWGLDFVTPNDEDDRLELVWGDAIPNHPMLTSAVYDEASGTTEIRGVLDQPASFFPDGYEIEFFASAAADSAGHGEGATFLGTIEITAGGSFAFSTSDDLRGAFITATSTVNEPVGFKTGQTLPPIHLHKTSEFSNAIRVTE